MGKWDEVNPEKVGSRVHTVGKWNKEYKKEKGIQGKPG